MTEHLRLNGFPELELESIYDKEMYSAKSSSVFKNTQHIKVLTILFSKYLV